MSKPSVLIVDDDKDIVAAIRAILELEEYEVYHAYNGNDSLTVADSKHPDVILLDLMLPDMSGVEVSQKLRENPKHIKTPVILISAAREAPQAAKNKSITTYLPKPFEADDLLETIEKHIVRAD